MMAPPPPPPPPPPPVIRPNTGGGTGARWIPLRCYIGPVTSDSLTVDWLVVSPWGCCHVTTYA